MSKVTPNTIEARDALRSAGFTPIYTNKSAGHKGNERRVKAYIGRNSDVDMLRQMVGFANVKLPSNPSYSGRHSVTVKCFLE